MNSIFGRAVAFYIDVLIFSIPSYWLYTVIFFKTFEEIYSRSDNFKLLFIQIVSYLMYFTICEFFFKSTIGKSLFQLKVMGKDKPLSFVQILKRTFFRIVPLNQISFLLNDEKIFWHEQWSKIYTVKKNSTPH